MMINFIFVFVFIAGACKAVMDTLQFHYDDSIFESPNDRYWDASLSWRNKYKNKDVEQGEKFWGSTTIFVALTDGWHLFQALFLGFIFLSIVTYNPILNYEVKWLSMLFDYCLLRVIFGLSFNLFYYKILKR
ncbi:MAG: hypothetical protein IT212_07510 [Bacteroidia bacterium]|nr:hypothetical protein [Bacteroidia bacterium]